MTEKKSYSNVNTIHALQALRGVAVSLVVLFHTTQLCADYYQFAPLNGLFLFGFSGVHLFFVLSGFIILTIHYRDINQPRRLVSYLKKRFVRIYPIYWITLAIFSVWLFFRGAMTLDDIYASIGLVTMPWRYVNPVSWTLTFEIAFYLIFASLIINRRLGIIILCGWLIALAAAHLFDLHPPFVLRHLTHKYVILFMIGLTAAYLSIQWRQYSAIPNQGRVHDLFALGVIVFAITAYFCLANQIRDWDLWSVTLGFGIASGLMMMAALSPALEQFFQSRHLLTSLGDASYSIYLMHYLLIKTLVHWLKLYLPTTQPVMITLIFITVAIIVTWTGWLLHRLIERPLLHWLRRKF
ncbi:acyltransferase family protein [Thiospirillum jenense]|uniref:Acyltransferase n=1 Tax=Thiospirillum jenense TaxID=1653858 RepID=A0A839HDL9_9GAMM|nr:acyltransferase [Thiospirillum jenense]MBB1126731.1 acyltransferase [Thiospirillum jenense]